MIKKHIKTVKIGKKEIQNYAEPFVIAEIGANHNGNLDLAEKLIKNAKKAGADSAKFQLWSKTNLSSRPMYENDPGLIQQIESWAFGNEEMIKMKKICDQNNILFSCTPVTKENVDFLVEDLQVEFMKVASMDVTNYPFLEYIAKKDIPIIMSTGAATLSEVDEAVRTIEKTGNENLVLLHCLCLYPPTDEEINLLNIDTLRDIYNYPIGYSDHSIGTVIPLAAIARGACCIEKHFTLDKKMDGWDHSISADFEDLKTIVDGGRQINTAFGHPERIPSDREFKQRMIFRRSIFTAREISEGEIISENDLVFKRPGNGLEPKNLNLLVGNKAKRDLKEEEMIQWSDIDFVSKVDVKKIKLKHV